jgi:hypothetical protein
MANHVCNGDMVSETRELIRVEPGGKKTYQLWTTRTCDICGSLASKVSGGTVEE